MVRIDENKVIEYNFGKVSLRKIGPDYQSDRKTFFNFTFAKFDEELHVEEKLHVSLSIEDLNTIIAVLDREGFVEWRKNEIKENKND